MMRTLESLRGQIEPIFTKKERDFVRSIHVIATMGGQQVSRLKSFRRARSAGARNALSCGDPGATDSSLEFNSVNMTSRLTASQQSVLETQFRGHKHWFSQLPQP
jgi:hypothetical protein